ncbi:alpha/beta-hydrolase, partial [Microstroma glucosiphilum]
ASTATLSSSNLHLLVQNNLDWATLDEHPGFLLSEALSDYSTASIACAGLAETLASPGSANVDLQKQLSYLLYKGVLSSGQSIWTSDSQLLTLIGTDGSYTLSAAVSKSAQYAVLCTQSAPRKTAYTTDTSSNWDVRVKTPAGSVVTGYRDGLSFRFHAIPYASTPVRFTYSTADTSARVINATVAGTSKQCPQNSGTYTENCLVLSIWTTYLPSASANASSLINSGLRPIMVWVHGGGNVAGTGLDPTFDGGQLASRGDVVVVNINYRLGTLGTLPISDDLTGNYGLQDIVTALKWLKTNAATFGGDASSITLFGQSSGANLIQILLGNPSATGLFHKVIIQSGKPADSYNGALASDTSETKAAATLSDLGCTKSTTAATLACLRALPVSNFLSGTVYSQTTVDSKFVPQRAYALNGHGHTTNRVPVLMGFMRDEMASLGYVPPKSVVNLSTAMTNAGIVKRTRQIVLDNPDVFPKSIPNGVQNLTVQVESYNSTGSRCGIPATAYAAVRSGAFPNVWVYTQDQRSYQIPNYDPYGVCQPSTGSMAGNSSAYYFCHSGDLLSTFANPMYEFGMGDRDGEDLDWIRNVVDQWTAFAHNSDPNPTDAYRSARGYSAVQGDPWPKLSTSSGAAASRMISLGPEQVDIPLVYSPEQCDILGNGIEYIYK